MLSYVLNEIAAYGVNILTIHLSIPVNRIAAISISVEIMEADMDVAGMMEAVEKIRGVQYIKILARE